MTPALSVIVCTWNRASLLDGALAALTTQADAPAHEIIVVDNASVDGTTAVVARWASGHATARYVFEPRRGLSRARNAGIRAARADLVAFTDDDVRVAPDWMVRIVRAFGTFPEAACIGGPVRPEWSGARPPWLTPRQWAPLGIQDYGPAAFRVDAERPVCLIGANLAFRRAALEAVGEFSPAVQRVGGTGGSTEDHEFHLRLWRAGLHGMYVPGVRASGIVLPDRLRKSHHRAWHFHHGRHIARMRLPDVEATRVGRLGGVPAHLVRQAAGDLVGCAASWLSGDSALAFEREARLWFVAGFVRERWA